MFYSSDNASSGTEIGGSRIAITGISLKYAKWNSTDDSAATITGTTNLYKIRLPKNAKSFKVSVDSSTLSSNYVPLYETNFGVTVTDGGSNNTTLTLPEYHHAGTTFYIASDGQINTSATDGGKTLRSGYTAPTSVIADPLYPRTDSDYIYFTDDSGFANNNTVYAYYYGGADGEYTKWPGIKASTDDTAPLTYTDDDGNTVYMFQLPKVSDGKYPYVIFSNGSAADGSRKVTQAIPIMNDGQTEYNSSGMNYRVDTSGTEQNYGTYDTISEHYVVASPTKGTSKIVQSTEDYNSNQYIYIANNGTYDILNEGYANFRYVLDDVHVVFYDKDESVIGTDVPGYKPDKLVNQSYSGSDVYRIQVPSNAVYFQINNGVKDGTAHDYERQSEMKMITLNALYQFVPSATNTVDYIQESSLPTKQSDAHFLLEIVNTLAGTDEELPESNVKDIHLATVVTGDGGTVSYIKWLKDDISNIDHTYLANTDGTGTVVKVKKKGDYYWKESAAPSGYEVNPYKQTFSIPSSSSDGTVTTTYSDSNKNSTVTKSISDSKIVGSLILEKDLTASTTASTDNNQKFVYQVVLTAPSGTAFATDTISLANSASYVTNHGPTLSTTTGTNDTLTFRVEVSKETSVKVNGIPYGTSYKVTEILGDLSNSGWKNTEHNAATGTILSSSAVTASETNTKVGSLQLKKRVEGSGAPDSTFTFTVVLLNNDLSLSESEFPFEYIYSSGAQSNGASVTRNGGKLTVILKKDQDVTIKGIPSGTQYQVTETSPGSGWSGSYKVNSAETATAGLVTPLNTVTTSKTDTVEFINTYDSVTPPTPTSDNAVILTKTAKEKVGTNNIGDTLTGAKFLLYNADDDTLVETFNQAMDASNNAISGEYTYVSNGGTFNTAADNESTYMETGNVSTDTAHYGKLKLTKLPIGNYYLKEMVAPTGYSEIDSKTGENRKVYFSVGSNTVEKELTCADEMAPAYIRLFEHIEEFKPDEWGHPTFVFKITNTTTNKTNLVSLTFDGTTSTEEKIATTIKWYNNGTAVLYGTGNDPIDDSKYADWYVEGTTESEYEGMYHIDSEGRIKVEPGTYSITRVPVSRYEFVTSGHVVYNTDTEPDVINNNDITTGTETVETVTLSAGQTGDIHYYDKVGYYDKFSQVDEEINKFYTLDSTTKANKTIKGIRIADYHSTLTSGVLNLNDLNLIVYAIYADGSEGELNSIEKAKITFSAYTSPAGEDPVFNPTRKNENKTLTVSNVENYKGNVYTITATYPYDNNNSFTATFDLVFSRT